MIKLKYTLYTLYVILPVAGWYLPEALVKNMAESCEVKSLIIYDEHDQTIFNNARWYSEAGRSSHNYSAHMVRQRNGYPDDVVTAERTVKTETTFSIRYMNVSTVQDHRLSGPVSSDHWPGSYIDPVAEEGFHASVWLFRIGDSWLTGFEGRPRAICHPSA